MRSRLLVAVLPALLAACATAEAGSPPRPSVPRVHEVVVLTSPTGVTTLDGADGRVLFSGPGITPPGRSSRIYAATTNAGTTLVRARDASGRTLERTRVTGGPLDLRVVSTDGGLVALMAPLPSGAEPWVPTPRTTTRIVVASLDGVSKPRSFVLKGNYEPEAFSLDGRMLVLIKYIPATAPEAYRVTQLDLRRGRVFPVWTRSKATGPVETMAGTRLEQIASPGAERLYTLYTTQPSRYAEGHDEEQAAAGEPVAFVHTLSLEEGWAHCTGLPKVLWGADPNDEAMAAFADRLFVVDGARDVVVEMDMRNLKPVRTVRADLHELGTGPTSAAISDDGQTLYVARGDAIVSLGVAELAMGERWSVGATVTGLASTPDGRRLYASTTEGLRVLDMRTGGLRTIGGPAAATVSAVERTAS